MSVMIITIGALQVALHVHLHDGLHVLEPSNALFFHLKQGGGLHDHFVVFFDSDFLLLGQFNLLNIGVEGRDFWRAVHGAPHVVPTIDRPRTGVFGQLSVQLHGEGDLDAIFDRGDRGGVLGRAAGPAHPLEGGETRGVGLPSLESADPELSIGR